AADSADVKSSEVTWTKAPARSRRIEISISTLKVRNASVPIGAKIQACDMAAPKFLSQHDDETRRRHQSCGSADRKTDAKDRRAMVPFAPEYRSALPHPLA